MNCTRCEGRGFLNLHQVDEATLYEYDETGDPEVILKWISDRAKAQQHGCTCAVTRPPCQFCETQHDVSVCDCCGDGEGWYYKPGVHDLTDNQCPFPECY